MLNTAEHRTCYPSNNRWVYRKPGCRYSERVGGLYLWPGCSDQFTWEGWGI